MNPLDRSCSIAAPGFGRWLVPPPCAVPWPRWPWRSGPTGG